VTFRGFPEAGIDFYRELDADNTRAFWLANKHRYEADVKGPMLELCDELADYGTFHLFRPYNDVRFAKGKPPYKTAQGAYTEGEGGAGFYVHFAADGLMCGSGYYAMAKDQLERFRTAVADDARGGELAEIVGRFDRTYRIGAIDELKTAPRGYPKDHPRIDFLRRKGLMVSKEFGTPKWLHTKAVVARVRSVWEAAGPMNEWLDTHVGPSELEPEGFFPR
jgi:uncharacterized protein (TIGR02453 family)